jgi:hypothetical protein
MSDRNPQELIDVPRSRRDLAWHQDAVAELRRSASRRAALAEWHEKTEWVQDTCRARDLGLHRADVMSKCITELREAARMALEVLEALQGGCTDSDDGTVEAITVHCPEVIAALREALGDRT